MKTPMSRRKFIRLVGGGVVCAALPSSVGCTPAIPEAAIEAWRSPQESLEIRKWILSYAILAPHSHNLQSWLVALQGENEMVLYLDPLRILPETDPYFRQIMMSHGTFLELLSIAARERGLRADIELFPEGIREPIAMGNQPIAKIRLEKEQNFQTDPLFRQILRRHTNRGIYEDKEVGPEIRQVILESFGTMPCSGGFVGGENRLAQKEHREIAKSAWKIEMTTPRTILESYKLLRIGPAEIEKYRDGISITSPLLRLVNALGLFDRSQAPSADDRGVRSQIEDFHQKLDASNSFFWIVTEGNDRRKQIESGRAYARAQLSATAAGLSMHPLQQALQEYPEQRENYQAIHQLLGAPTPRYTVQMWARVGSAEPVPPAPRRGLAHHILG